MRWSRFKQNNRKLPPGRVRWLAGAVLGVALLSVGYCLYDLAYPGHFVGDMYGLEVLMRLLMLAGPAVALLVSGAVLHFAGNKRSRFRRAGAGAVLVISALLLAVLAGDVARDRRHDAIRRRYPLAGTEELLRIARERENDLAVAAIDELLVRRDPAAIPGLCAMLLDETESVALRGCAAHALGEIGGEKAKAALEKVRAGHPHETLKTAVDYALEVRMTSEKSSA